MSNLLNTQENRRAKKKKKEEGKSIEINIEISCILSGYDNVIFLFLAPKAYVHLAQKCFLSIKCFAMKYLEDKLGRGISFNQFGA